MYNEVIGSRIESLRKKMTDEGLNYYLITSADYHNSEYVSDFFKCREYMSGFNGSNGNLLVWNDGAALWTDGRYFLQAAQQLEGTGIELMKMGEKNVPTVSEFLKKNMMPGQKLGLDGRCITLNFGEELEKAVCAADKSDECEFVWNLDLISEIWNDRPNMPNSNIWFLEKKHTGSSRSERLNAVREKMKAEGAGALILASLDDIAWLFLMRADDIEYNPVALSYAVVTDKEVYLYINSKCIDDRDRKILSTENISVREYRNFDTEIAAIVKKLTEGSENYKIMMDPDRTSYAVFMKVKTTCPSGAVISTTSPTVSMKAAKTEEEIEFERSAHIKDAVAVCKLLYRLDGLRNDAAFLNGSKKVSELEIAKMLLSLRKDQPDFIEESFAPIIATGAHGAIIHYEPDEKSNAVIQKDTFLLMDTGAQFLQGTTDITRTVVMGQPTEEMKKLYTAVLIGNLELADAYFPENTTGSNLDAIARKALWKLGLDFRHGTGHGVGFLLNVHEGPQNISRRGRNGKMGASFVHGMITSDEPGVYIDGKFGIRLENMMVCLKDRETEYGLFHRFETLTMVPFDRRSIEKKYMTEYDVSLLNDYHKKVFEKVSPYLNEEEKNWLAGETAPF